MLLVVGCCAWGLDHEGHERTRNPRKPFAPFASFRVFRDPNPFVFQTLTLTPPNSPASPATPPLSVPKAPPPACQSPPRSPAPAPYLRPPWLRAPAGREPPVGGMRVWTTEVTKEPETHENLSCFSRLFVSFVIQTLSCSKPSPQLLQTLLNLPQLLLRQPP